MSYSNKELVSQYKNKELPEEPRYKKRKKPIKIKRSNHKHEYKPCLFRIKKWDNLKVKKLYGGSYCIICGRIDDITIGGNIYINGNIPIFEIDDFFTKYVNLED